MSGNGFFHRRWFLAAALAVLAAGTCLLAESRRGFYDDDEFEHLSAAHEIRMGLCPYRDFFEHHVPGFWMALAPFTAGELGKPKPLRLVMVVFAVAGVVAAGAAFAKGPASFLAGAVIAGLPVAAAKLVEIRPDVPAFAFAVAGMTFLAAAAKRERRGVGLAVLGLGLFSVAAAFQMKWLFMMPAPLVLFGIVARRDGRGRRNAAVGLAVAGIPWLSLLGWLSARGALGDFWRSVVVLNAAWPEHFSMWGTLRLAFEQNPAFLVLGVLGAAYAAGRNSGESFLRWTPAVWTANALLLLVVTPNPYPQAFLPLWAGCAWGLAAGTARFFEEERLREDSGRALAAGAMCLLLLGVAPFFRERLRNAPVPDEAQARRLAAIEQYAEGRTLAVLSFIKAHPGHRSAMQPGWCYEAVVQALGITDLDVRIRRAWRNADAAVLDYRWRRMVPDAAAWVRTHSISVSPDAAEVRGHGAVLSAENFSGNRARLDVLRGGNYALRISPPQSVTVNGTAFADGAVIPLAAGAADVSVSGYVREMVFRLR
ncbi:MAG: hypothetical protein V1809_06360 [Planctomycetota bacterium]